MHMVGKIVVIRKNGTDGNYFPLTESCLFGRSKECDVRIQLPEVSKEHCRIAINCEGKIVLTNLSQVNPTLVNNKPVTQTTTLNHHDIVTVVHRSFRIEYPPESLLYSSAMSDSAKPSAQLRKPLKPKVQQLDQNTNPVLDAETPMSASKPATPQRSIKTPAKMSEATPEHMPVADEPGVQAKQSNVDATENAMKRSPKLSTLSAKSARRVSQLHPNNDQVLDADTPKSASKPAAGSQRSSISSARGSIKTPVKMSEETPEHMPVASETVVQAKQSNVDTADNAMKKSPKLSTPSARRSSKLHPNNDQVLDADTPKSASKPAAGSQRSSISSAWGSIKTPVKMSKVTPEHMPVASETVVQAKQSKVDTADNAMKKSQKLSTPSARRSSKLHPNNDQVLDADTPKSASKPAAGSQRSSISSARGSIKRPVKMSEVTPEHMPVASETVVQAKQSKVDTADNAMKKSPKLSTPSARRSSKLHPNNDQVLDADTPKSASKPAAGSQRSSISSARGSIKTPVKMSKVTPEHMPVASKTVVQAKQSKVDTADNAMKKSPKLSTPSARRSSKLHPNNDQVLGADTPKSASKPAAGSQRSSISSARGSIKTPVKMSKVTPEHMPVASKTVVQAKQSKVDTADNAMKKSPKLSTPSARRSSKLHPNNDQVLDADTPKSASKPAAGSQRSSISSARGSIKTPVKMSDVTPEHMPVASETVVQAKQSKVDTADNAMKKSPKLSTPSARRSSKLHPNNDQVLDADTPKSASKPAAGSQRSSISSARGSIKRPVKMSEVTPEHMPVASETVVQAKQSKVDTADNAMKKSPKLSTPSARRSSKLHPNNDQVLDADTPKSASKPAAGSQRSSISSARGSIKRPVKMSEVTPEHMPVASETVVQAKQSKVDTADNAMKKSPKLSTPSARRSSKLHPNNDQVLDADTPKSASKPAAGSQRSSISSARGSIKRPVKMSEVTPEHMPVASETVVQAKQSKVDTADNAMKKSPKLSTPSARRSSKLHPNNDQVLDADTPKSASKPAAGSQRSSISSARGSIKRPVKMSEVTPEHMPVASETVVQAKQSKVDTADNAMKKSPKLSTPSARRSSKLHPNNDQVLDADTPKSASKPAAGSQRSSISSARGSIKTPVKMSEVTPEHVPVASETVVQAKQSNVDTADNAMKKSPKLSTPSARRSSKVTPGSSPRFIKKTPLKTGITKLRRSSVTLQEADEVVTPQISTDCERKRKLTGDIPMPLGKRRSVRFGPQLSPEEFALHMPPNTPIRKGASPLQRSVNCDQLRCSFASIDRAESIVEESPIISPKVMSPSTLVAGSSSASKNDAGAVSSVRKTPPRRISPSLSSKAATRRSPSKSPKRKSGNKTPVNKSKKTPRLSTGKKCMLLKCQEADGGKVTGTSPKSKLGAASLKKSKSPGLMKTPTISSTPAKAVALRAIYGKEATPKLPSAYLKSLTKSQRKTAMLKSTPELSKQVTPRSARLSGTPMSEGQKNTPKVSLFQATPECIKAAKTSIRKSAPKPASPKGTPISAPKRGSTHLSPKVTPRAVIQGSMPKSAHRVTPKSGVKARRTPMKVSTKKTPRTRRSGVGSISAKKPQTWAEVVRRGVPGRAYASKKALHRGKVMVKTLRRTKIVRESKGNGDLTVVAPAFSSTGHAQSPATVVIRKRLAKTPKPLPKKGRKAAIYQSSVGGAGDVSFDGLSDLLSTPKSQTPNTSCLSLAGNPSPYSDLPPTPEGPGEMMVSPLSVGQETPTLDGIRDLVKTPKCQQTPQLSGVHDLLKTPKEEKTPRLDGVRDLVKTPKEEKTPRFDGVRDLVKTPKDQQTPRLGGIRDLFKTPKEQNSPKLRGIRNLLKTPEIQMSPKLDGISDLLKTPEACPTPGNEEDVHSSSGNLFLGEVIMTKKASDLQSPAATAISSEWLQGMEAVVEGARLPSPTKVTSSRSLRNRRVTAKKATQSSTVKGSRGLKGKKKSTDGEAGTLLSMEQESVSDLRHSPSPVNTVSPHSTNKRKVARKQEMPSSPVKIVSCRSENAVVELKSMSPLISTRGRRTRKAARKVVEGVAMMASNNERETCEELMAASPIKVALTQSSRKKKVSTKCVKQSSPGKMALKTRYKKKEIINEEIKPSPVKPRSLRNSRKEKKGVIGEDLQSLAAGKENIKPPSITSLNKKGVDQVLKLCSPLRKEDTEVSPAKVVLTRSSRQKEVSTKLVKQSSPGNMAPSTRHKKKEASNEKMKPSPVKARSTRSSRKEKKENEEVQLFCVEIASTRGSKKNAKSTKSATSTDKKDEKLIDEKAAVASLPKIVSARQTRKKQRDSAEVEATSPVRTHSKRTVPKKPDQKEVTSSRKTCNKNNLMSKEIAPASPGKDTASSKHARNKATTKKLTKASAAISSGADAAAGGSTKSTKRKADPVDDGSTKESVKKSRATRTRLMNDTPADDHSGKDAANVRCTRAKKRTAAANSIPTRASKRVKSS